MPSPKISRTSRPGHSQTIVRQMRYDTGEAPYEGDIVHPFGDWSGLLYRHYIVLGVSRYPNAHTRVCVRPLFPAGEYVEPERRTPVDEVVSRFKLIQRGVKS